MAVKRLTATVLDKSKVAPGARLEVWDDLLPGFGVRLSKPGVGSFFVMYRTGGKLRRHSIGRYPMLRLDEARELGRAALRAVAEGRDPSAEKAAAKASAGRQIYTFGNLLDDFIQKYAKPRTRGWRKAEISIRANTQAWMERAASSITRGDVREVMATIVDRGAAIQANRVLASLRKLFAWAVDEDLLAVSPVAGIKPPAKERTRDRILSEDEIKAVWDAAGERGYPFGPIVRLLMLTGQRRDEVASMRWSEIDMEKALWTLPRTSTKSDRLHEVPLSAQALAILADVPRIPGKAGVFPAHWGKSERFTGFGRAKVLLDEKAGVSDWVLHDLRRTAASGMARLGIAPHVVEKVLNHAGGTISGVAAVYNRHGYDAEKRAALEAWGRKVESIVRPGATNVVALRG